MSSANDEIAVAAGALLDRGEELFERACYEEALVVYGRVVERFGFPLGGRLREAVAGAAPALVGGLSSDAERASVASGDVVVGQVVASALVSVGLTLERLQRPEAALEAYDEVVARFGDTSHPLTLVRVAWAMYDKALVLSGLHRDEDAIAAFDAVISRFAEATDPRLRPRVGWSLWKRSKLVDAAGRRAQALADYHQLIVRHDELIEPELAGIVSWCMGQVAGELRRAGRRQDELLVYEDLIERFAQASDEYVTSGVAHAFSMKAHALYVIGDQDQAIAVYEQMAARFHEDSRGSIRDLLADSLCRQASLLENLERVTDAVAAFDDGLSLLDGSRDALLLRRKIVCLLDKGTLLARAERDTEAIVIFDGAVSAYNELAEVERDGGALGLVVLALLHKIMSVCRVDPGSSPVVVAQLAELLGDVSRPATAARGAHTEPLSEREIAALLAQLYNGECWLQFATSGDDQPSLEAMQQRALALYRQTAGWLEAGSEDWDTPALGAVILVRQLADGYALLARKWSASGRANLSLPSSLLMEVGIQQFGIDHWAAEQGHPLQLSDTSDLALDLIQSEHARGKNWEPDLSAAFITSVRHYEMLAVLCDSPTGREALHIKELKRFASDRINESRQVAAWAWQHREEAAGVAATRIFITQAYFVATHTTMSSSHDISPSREALHEMLRQTDAHTWLEHENIELPDWLNPPGDY